MLRREERGELFQEFAVEPVAAAAHVALADDGEDAAPARHRLPQIAVKSAT
jgi:hypothetical protein